MIKPITEKTYEFFINNNDMQDGKPKFTTYNGLKLVNGTSAINMDTKKVYFWDEEVEDWK